MRKLRELEDVLIRAESALAVMLVLVMLALASYNVVYRNVLVPLQQHWAHSGPPRTTAPEPSIAADGAPTATPKTTATAKPEPTADGGADGFGGFGGGLGEEGGDEPTPEPEPAKAEPASDDFGGFGGGFGDDEPEPAKAEPEPAKAEPEPASNDFGGFGGGFGDDEPEPEPAKAEPTPEPGPAKAEPASDDFGGFGGGFGDDEPEPTKAEPASADEGGDGAEGFGGFGGGLGDDEGGDAADGGAPEAAPSAEPEQAGDDDDIFGDDGDDPFANLADIDVTAKQEADDVLQGGPPPEGSWQAKAVAFVDAIKLDWIDVFLRQLVIIVSFLGAMLATQRGKHINIDALSKTLPPQARRVVGVVIPLAAVSVCLVFASAGWDLVEISREYPKELLPWAEEWTLQLMFPVGFGLLALHFGVRLVEALVDPPPGPAPPQPGTAVEPRAPQSDPDRLDDEPDEPEPLAEYDDSVPSRGGKS